MSDLCLICEFSSDIWRCYNCDIKCCAKCFGHHNSSCNDLKTKRYHMCDIHQEQQVIRYCFDCDLLLCKTCLEFDHNQHTCLLLTDAFLDIKENTKQLIDDAEVHIETLDQVKNMLEENKKKLHTCSTDDNPMERDSNKSGILELNQIMITRTTTLLECLQNAILLLKCLLEKDIFLIVFLRQFSKGKEMINAFKDKEMKFIMEAKRKSERIEGLQNVFQIFLLSSNGDTLTHSYSYRFGVYRTSGTGTQDLDETTNSCQILMSGNENKPTIKVDRHQQHTRPFDSDKEIDQVTEMMSNVSIGRKMADDQPTCQTAEELLKDIMPNGRCIKPCPNSLCQRTLVSCAEMKASIKKLKSRLQAAKEALEIEKEHKLHIKEVSKGMLVWLTAIDIDKVKDFTGEWTVCAGNGDSDVEDFLENMKALLKMFVKSKEAQKTAEKNLKSKILYYTNWADEQRKTEIELTEKFQTELKSKQAMIEDMIRQVSALQSQLIAYKSENDVLQNANRNLKKRCNEILEAIQQKDKKSNEMIGLQQTIEQQNRDISILNSTKERLNWQLSDKEISLKILEREKKDLQLRLSTMAGDQLTKGNPTITDLSDPNRPMKIGDEFKEIYDNEWTDALECSKNVNLLFPDLKPSEIEGIVIQHLYYIVKNCYNECLEVAKSQIKTFRSTISQMFLLDRKEEETALETPPGLSELLKFRREEANQFAVRLSKMMVERLSIKDWQYTYKSQDIVDTVVMTSFFDKCVTQCWYMVIQDPPLYLDDEIPHGTTFDKTQYREFTSSGDKVQFVVWPALYLHKGGPLLCKGAIQAYN